VSVGHAATPSNGLDLALQGGGVFAGAPLGVLGFLGACGIACDQAVCALARCLGRVVAFTGELDVQDAQALAVASNLLGWRHDRRRCERVGRLIGPDGGRSDERR
jgi:hypothetical protein